MTQANFMYDAVNDRAGLPLTVAIFADRPHVRAEMRDDAEAAGFLLSTSGDVAALLAGDDIRVLGDIVLLDCPVLDAASMAALCRLDLRAARAGAHLVVSTSVDALDDVFACLDQSNPQILVDPDRAERVIALGRVLAQMPGQRMRELSQEDRLLLLRLTEQVSQLAARLGTPDQGDRPVRESGLWQVEAPRKGFRGAEGGENDGRNDGRLRPGGTPVLPDSQRIRQVIRNRQLRTRFFDAALFADPAWDILLDLSAARGEGRQVSVTSLCIASGVPATTALRWIAQMSEAGLLERVADEQDGRRAFIGLSQAAADGMARYFAELDTGAGQAA